MNATNLIQLARTKKQERVLTYLRLAFKGFAYPVYLFGSYATGEFHGHSDVDVLIIAPGTRAKKIYLQACDKMTELGMNYDILISPSINRLDSSIVTSLQAINVPVQPRQTSAALSRHQFGMTLIEIMIALLIGVFLLGGLLQIFLGNKQSYRLDEGQSRLQENARYALELLSHDIRLSGYLGCSRVSANNPVVIANDPLIAPYTQAGIAEASIVTGGNGGSTGSFTTPSPALSSSPLNTVVRNTDAVTVQFAESCGGYTATAMSTVDTSLGTANASAAISVNNSCGTITLGTTELRLGTPLVISDCNTAHIFRASADTSQNKGATGTATDALGKTYAAGSEIMPFRSYTYFIRENPAAQPALYRIDNNNLNGADELVEGIENMQITYGVGVAPKNTDGTYPQYQYKDAPAGAEWENVVSVRIVLTARSIDDNLTAKSRTYAYNGANNVTDRRLVRNFTTTIGLRNR